MGVSSYCSVLYARLPARVDYCNKVNLIRRAIELHALCYRIQGNGLSGLAQGVGMEKVIILLLPIAGNG